MYDPIGQNLPATMQAYLATLRLADRINTARTAAEGLRTYHHWLLANDLPDPANVTTKHIHQYHHFIIYEYQTPQGRPLARTTQATRLAIVKAFYAWLYRRGDLVINPAQDLKPPYLKHRRIQKDYLTQQEVTALVQTGAKRIAEHREGSTPWALTHRDCAMICLAVASGRRRSGLLNLTLADLDWDRRELRCAFEKGQVGRVQPVAEWAMVVTRTYVEQARPRLLKQVFRQGGAVQPSNRVFLGKGGQPFSGRGFARVLADIHQQTITDNPDLSELAAKHLTPHSLRVSFAKLLFSGGCSIRSINELLLHRKISTTAKYTPLGLDDLRRSIRGHHLRAS